MGNKILIVDDEPNFLFILRHALNRAGYEVVSAISGEECLEKVANEKPDLVILDIMMPGMDGWEVCKKIKEDSPDLPVSMCSILRDAHEIERSLKYAGADEHLIKPLSLAKIRETANAFLSGRRTSDASMPAGT